MINFFYIKNGSIVQEGGTNFSEKQIIWVDIINESEEEKRKVEKVFGIELFTKQESEEIETSSKYIETAEEIGINMNFIRTENGGYITEPVSFIIRKKTLFTQREFYLKSFEEVYKKIKIYKPQDGDDIYLILLDIRIDYDADLIENITDKISSVSKELKIENQTDRELLLKITALQESTIVIRENIVEKQRILSAMLKSKIFPKEDYETMRIMIKDIESLLEHSGFNFERLEFLQNTFLGLVDMEQNRVIKLFTVVTVIFMPPTLIASMYGMNFKFMPELDQKWGYPVAITLMFLSSILTLLFFKLKKWL